jgi:hypothetical protein
MNIDDHSHNFVLTLSGVVEPSGELEDALFEVGCDDATLAFRNRVAYLEFDRRAPNLDAAIRSAIRDVESADAQPTLIAVETRDSS